jgi:hypothetical protein
LAERWIGAGPRRGGLWWRTGRRHRRCSSAQGGVTSLYRWRACSLVTGGRTGGGASGERAARRHQSDRGSRRGGTATRSARRPRLARRGMGKEWPRRAVLKWRARMGTEATARRGLARRGAGATQRVGLATFDQVLVKNFE